MKKIVLLVVLFVFVYTANAQSFTISPSNNLPVTVSQNTYHDASIYMVNTSGGTLNLEYELVSNTVPRGWFLTLCDYQQCFANIPASRVMEPIPNGTDGFIKLTIGPGMDLSSGSVIFKVWEVGNRQATEQTISYDINSIVGIDNQIIKNVIVYPNPAQDYLLIKADNGMLESGYVKMFDLSGAVVLESKIAPVQTQKIDMEHLPAGMYLMLYESKGATMTQKVFKTN